MSCESIVSRSLLLTAVSTIMFAVGSTSSVFADSPAELLEKAIYIEETVGDLDKAIDGYQQVLSASEPAIDAAAEAQYRIGACLARQGKTKMAVEAFQLVAENHRASKAWVKRTAEQLATLNQLLPIPWGDGDELHMHMKLPGGMAAGYQVFRVAKKNVDGKDYWECQNWQTVTLNNAGGKSRVLVDFDSFAPIESHWRHNLLGEASAEFSSSEVAITMVGKEDVKTLELDPPAYDNEQGAQVFRRLPLAKGYEGTINVVPTLTQTLVPLELKVTEVETIKVPAGEYECFRLELSIGQTFWISTGDKREIVRFEGGGVEANLVEVRKAGSASTTTDGEKFSLTLPVGWYSFDSDDVTWLLDPDNSMRSRVVHLPIDADEKQFDSPQAWLKSKIGEIKKFYKNVSAGESGIKTLNVANHKAAVLDFEFDGDKARRHGRRFIVFGPKTAFDVEFLMPADEKDKQFPEIQKLIDSMELK